MPGVAVDVGHGTTVTFATTGFTAELTSLRLVGMARTVLDASHMSVTAASVTQFGNRPYLPGRLVNAGQLVIGLHFNPQTNPPIGAPPEVLTITWPIPPGDTFARTWTATGFVASMGVTDSLDEIMVGEATVQLNSTITNTTTGSFPLDMVAASTGAWSTRKVSSTYTGSCLRVRRSSDDAELDIGFSGVLLDTAALLAFVGVGNGFVVTWYDQSGAGINRDFAQLAKPNQPSIVTSGALLTTVGGQPSLVFDGATSIMVTDNLASAYLTVAAGTVLCVFEATLINTANSPAYDNDGVWCNTDSQIGLYLHSTTPSARALNDDGVVDFAASTIALNTSYVHVWRHGSSVISSYLNNNTATQSTASGNTSALNTQLQLGRNYDTSPVSGFFAGGLAEMITFNTALSVDDIDLIGDSMADGYGISWT